MANFASANPQNDVLCLHTPILSNSTKVPLSVLCKCLIFMMILR